MKSTLVSKFIPICAAMALMLALSLAASAQNSGRIKGTIRVASGAPMSGIGIVATNQVTGKWKRVWSNAEGVCEFQLPAGDYRLKPDGPSPRAEVLKNVIVEPGKETVVDIPLDQVEVKEVRDQPGDKRIASAVSESIPAEPKINRAPVGQESGRIKGTVHMASGAPMSGIGIVATNQVTGKWKRVWSNAEGVCEFQLPAGDYRLKPDGPYPRAEVLKNVIVEPGKETVVDIPLDQVEVKEVRDQPGDKPIASAVSESIPAEPKINRAAVGQESGRIKGTVHMASGAPMSGIGIVATNQVTGKWKRVWSNAEGVCEFQLPAGDYRLKPDGPYPRAEVLKNVIVEPGKETVVDIPLDQVEVKEVRDQPDVRPVGNSVIERAKETPADIPIPLEESKVTAAPPQPDDKPAVNAFRKTVRSEPQFIQTAVGPVSGRIKGSVHMASGAIVSGIGIVATNQITGKWKRVLSNAAGVCEFQLPAGAYRLKPDAPYARPEALKNVVVEPGKETVVDIPLEDPGVKEVLSQPDVTPVGNVVNEPVNVTPVDVPIDRVKTVGAISPGVDKPIHSAVSETVSPAPQITHAPQISQAGLGQGSGRIKGTVRVASGAPISGIEIVATNQVTGRWRRVRTSGEGVYVFQLPAGAYRLKLSAPHVAKFDKDKNYGDFSLPRGEALENVIVEPGKETVVDIPLDQVEVKEIPPQPGDKPLGNAGSETVESEPQLTPDRREARDRWRIGFPEYDRYGDRAARGRDIPFKKGRWWDPYNQSVLKGDYPIRGNNTFLILSAVSTTSVEQRRAPTPSDVSSDEPLSAEFFGQPEQFAANQTVQLSFELFHGDTTFKPRDWAIKISPTFSIPNYLNARENGVVNIDVRRGANRTDTHFSLEEAFGEVKLFDINSNYDFVSVRAGIQSFSSDFRGFIFSDNNLAFRVFGAADNNRVQFNAAYFSMLEKDTNSGLNTFDTRHQNVYVANVFRQDFIRKGYTIQASALYNDDRRSVEYDTNGFLVRPAFIGDVRPHAIKVGYVGINGDGHLGKLNLTNSYYYAFGRDDRNPIAGRSVAVRSHMAAVEASMDRDFLRFKGSIFFAQGDSNPTDEKATGFDAILDDPNFVGGQFSFWNRNGIRLTQTGVGLVQGNSLLPSLRSSKTQGQANFVNPGILIYNAGVDADVTQRIKAVFNVNYLRFHRTEPLEYVLFQNHIRHEIGWDYSLGVAYRPFLINNVTMTFGANTLQTGRGFRDIFTDRSRNCPSNVGDFCQPHVINPRKPLYSLFAQLKFIF